MPHSIENKTVVIDGGLSRIKHSMNGFTCLMQAVVSTVSKASAECVELLIDAGADVKATSPQLGLTMLHLAAVNQEIEVVRLLLRKAPELCFMRD